jgi:dienelactone hydrolase
MLPSRPVDWVTKTPVIKKVRYPTLSGEADGEVYLPGTNGPHPGIVVCLGVVPFGIDHPQVPVLGKALARAGIAALLYWSPAMRDFRFDTGDIENIALAYDWLISQPYIDPARSGLLGTCVGGSFALMAAAQPLIRDRVAFLTAYAPFSSMPIFARDIASSTRSGENGRELWKVDQLTRKVFVHSLAAWLEPADAEQIRSSFEVAGGQCDREALSADGQVVYDLLSAQDESQAETALNKLPIGIRETLVTLSPIQYLEDIHAPLMVLLHDRGDQVIPVGESRRLMVALTGRPGVHFTEMQFSHLDPSRGKLPFFRLVREFGKFFCAMYPIFRQSVE